MNVYDSERISDVLAPLGYTLSENSDDADLIILNTCHIREKAAEKVYSELGRIRSIKDAAHRAGKQTMVAVAGCVAQAEGEEMIRRAPTVDLVFGPQVYHRLPDLLKKAANGERVVATDFPVDDKFGHLPAQRQAAATSRAKAAFLTIQEGCDKFCTFCVVPYTRGAEMSRPAGEILSEARRLADAGVSEITLLGQNVNAYHGASEQGSMGLADLLDYLSEIGGLERLRYTTSHPRDMSDNLIAVHRDNAKVMPYLHLPVQSGSDRILAKMNRKHTAKSYLEIIARLRAARPDIALSSDFIVGFPGETDEDFADTMKLVEAVGYAQAYSFKYSPRPGTPAADSDEQVPEAIKSERLTALQALITAQQLSFNQGMVGATVPVLLDRAGRKAGQLAGRTPYLQAIQIDAPQEMFGTIQSVRVETAGPHSLFGRLVNAAKDEQSETRANRKDADLMMETPLL